MAPPSTSSISPSFPPRSHLFTPIQEGNESEEASEFERSRFDSSTPPSTVATSSCTDTVYHHQPTPLHQPGTRKTRKPPPQPDRTVSCTGCRPTTREKTSVTVVPVDNHHPNGLFKSIVAGISRRSPKPEPKDHWRITVAELSHKLLQATRKRDEAILEASKLKYSMAELEKKLNRLEVYCQNLKSGLELCHQAQTQSPAHNHNHNHHHDVIIKNFLIAVSESRSSIRYLSKSLTSQLKLMGVKVFERLSTVLKSYDFKLSSSSSSTNHIQYKTLQYYLEAVLNSTYYQEFESMETSMDQILNPVHRSEAYYSAFNGLKDLSWEQVLNQGTKHFSEEFSRFCDKKMSEIVGLLGWNRAWPEQLLQAFFGASKSVWLVYLLANSVHPRLLIFRVGKGVRFDPVYMEDMGGDKDKKLTPTMVKIMVAPGFYVFDNVVKCKVISRYLL